MIELINVCKSFENKVLYDHYNLKIEQGEFVILTGKSGCGKTTLLNMIGALEEPDEGEVLVDGKNIYTRKNKQEFFCQKAGFLFQNFALIDRYSVKKNLDLVYKGARSGASMEDALQKVKLQDRADTPVYKLSGGEQQRVALARLMIKKCELILADEPTGSLDPVNSVMVMEILKGLNKEGKTIVMVTHNMDLISYGTRHIDLSHTSDR